MLIRHNVRTGRNQGAHFAHDTNREDTNGCYVSGRPGKVFTSESARCPQCSGYGALVAIQALPRAAYPSGSVVPEEYRLHGVSYATEPTVPAVSEPVPVVPVVPAVPAVSEPGNGTKAAAEDMARAMLGAIVPEATRIRETISEAVEQVTQQAQDANATAIGNAIDLLSERFDETVKRLIVPTTIRIERQDREPITIDGTVHNAFTECLEWLQARDEANHPRNLYLTGPAGCGKTTLARQLAQALEVPFYTTGQVLSEHQVTGFVDAGGSYHKTPFREAFENGGLWLGDEWDAWSPEATLAANAALANGHAAFPDNPMPVQAHPDFYVMAAANTWGNGADRDYVGRNEMDKASISRFVTIPMDYDKALETQIAGTWIEWRNLVWRVRDNARDLRMRVMVGTRELVHGVAGLNAGMTLDRVSTRILRRDLDETTWSKVTA